MVPPSGGFLVQGFFIDEAGDEFLITGILTQIRQIAVALKMVQTVVSVIDRQFDGGQRGVDFFQQRITAGQIIKNVRIFGAQGDQF